MTLDEAARLHLYELARDALDEPAADTLMNAIARDPDRFATKDEITLVRADLQILEANLRAELRSGNAELLRTLFFGMLASNATLVGLAFAAARLA